MQKHVHRTQIVLGLLLSALATPSEAQIFSQSATVISNWAETVHESGLAAGPRWVLNANTHKVAFHDKLAWNSPPDSIPISTLFGAPLCCDPVAHYDALRGRYLLVALGYPHTSVYLLISKNGADPRLPASWWRYTLTDPEGYDADYPGLGVSDDKVVVGWTQKGIPRYVYRVLDRAKAYDNLFVGGEPISTSIVRFGGSARFYKPCRNLTTPDQTIHLAALSDTTLYYGSITGPPGSPTLTDFGSVTSNGASVGFPPVGQQPDTTGQNSCGNRRIAANNGHLADVYMRAGNIAVAWSVATEYQGEGPPAYRVRCVRFRASDRQILDDFRFGGPGRNYSYPSVAEDARGTLFVGYARLSADQYPSAYMVARRGGNLSPEILVQEGRATFFECKVAPCADIIWGDYTSMVVDETASGPDQSTARYAGGWTRSPNDPGTAIGTLAANYGTCTVSGRVLASTGGTPFPRPGARVDLVATSGASGSTSANTDAAGAFSLGLLPPGTYRLRSSWGSAVALEAHTGTGGTSQTVISASEIEIVVQGGQTSAGNEFVVIQQPAPQIATLSSNVRSCLDPGFSLVVTGQNFRPHSVVRFDGRDKVTTYDPVTGNLTATILHNDFAYPDWQKPHLVTVFTAAAPGSGISEASPFTSLEPHLASIPSIPSQAISCPAGDAGPLTFSVAVKSAWWCQVNASDATAKLSLFAPTAPNIRLWDATMQTMFGFNFWEVASAGVWDPVSQVRTFTFNLAKVSGCGTLLGQIDFISSAGTRQLWFPDPISIRSPDLDARVRGTVDQFDAATLNDLYMGTDPCGDLVPNGSVDVADLNFLAAHSNHYFPRQLFAPNGGGVFPAPTSIPASWKWGGGDSAFVGFKLVEPGGATTYLTAGVQDDGQADVPLLCGVPYGQGKRLEVFHHSGAFRMEGPFSGSDRSDGTFTVQQSAGCGGGSGGGCPYLATWVGGSWHEENSILSRSATSQAARDLYRLTVAPDVDSEGRYRLRVREEGQDRTRLMDAEVLTVDRDPDQVSFAEDGRIGLGRFIPVHAVRSEAGDDLTAVLTDPRSDGYEVGPGEILHVELYSSTGTPPSGIKPRLVFGAAVKPTDPGPSRGSETDRRIIEQSGIAIERPDGNRGWVEVTRFHPRHSTADLSVEAGRELRLRFIGRHRIRALGWVRPTATDPLVTETVPASAIHSRLGDVRGQLAAGAREIVLESQEAVEMSFEARPIVVGKVRDYYFASRGYYGTPDDGSTQAALPGELRLHPARPNPTTGDVSIGFDLPKAAKVRITVYDAAGRLTRNLVDGERPAGRHDAIWNLQTTAGKRAPAGVYFYRMQVGSWRREMKVTVQ